MSVKKIEDAIEKTIRETQRETERQRRSGKINPTALMNMDNYRGSLEARLDYYKLTHPGPIKTIASAIIGPISFILSPVILIGGLAYLGGKRIYEEVKKHYSNKE